LALTAFQSANIVIRRELPSYHLGRASAYREDQEAARTYPRIAKHIYKRSKLVMILGSTHKER
jgi:hypothetical protein